MWNMVLFNNLSNTKLLHNLGGRSYLVAHDTDKYWMEYCPVAEPKKLPACQLCTVFPKCACTLTNVLAH